MAVRWKWKNGNESSDLFSSLLFFPVQFHEHTNKYFFTEASYGTNLDIKRKMVLRSKSISLLQTYLFFKEKKKERRRRRERDEEGKKITVTDSRKDENPREFTSSVEQRNSQPWNGRRRRNVPNGNRVCFLRRRNRWRKRVILG